MTSRGPTFAKTGGIASGLPAISAPNCIALVFLGVTLSIIFNIDNGQGLLFPLAYALAIAVAVSVCIIPLRLIALPFAVIVLLMPDLTQTALQVEYLGRKISASLWQLPVGPISPAVLVLICLGIALLRFSLVTTIRPFKVVFVYFFAVATLMSIMNGYAQESTGRFIADFKIVVFVYTSLVLFDAYFRRFPEETLRVSQLFLMFLIGSVLFQATRSLLTPADTSVQSYEHISLDSSKGLLLVITFYAIAKLGLGRRAILWAVVACLSLYMLIGFQTRWLIVTFALGLILTYLLYPFRRKVMLAVLIVPAVALGALVLIAIESEALRIMLVRFAFLQDLGRDTTIVDIEVVRGSSILNSVQQLWQQKAFVTGFGYGSWYSDDYLPMLNLNATAFDEESLVTGRFYRVHDFIFHFLFKFGIVGLAVYLWLFVKPLRKLWREKRNIMQVSGGTELLVVLLGIAPTVITYMWFTGKGNIFCGFYIALSISWLYVLESRGVLTGTRSGAQT